MDVHHSVFFICDWVGNTNLHSKWGFTINTLPCSVSDSNGNHEEIIKNKYDDKCKKRNVTDFQNLFKIGRLYYRKDDVYSWKTARSRRKQIKQYDLNIITEEKLTRCGVHTRTLPSTEQDKTDPSHPSHRADTCAVCPCSVWTRGLNDPLERHTFTVRSELPLNMKPPSSIAVPVKLEWSCWFLECSRQTTAELWLPELSDGFSSSCLFTSTVFDITK